MKGWKDHDTVMERELYIKTMEGVINLIRERIDTNKVFGVPPMIVVASPSESQSELPELSIFVMTHVTENNKHSMIGQLGEVIAMNNIQIAAAFLVAESFVVRTGPDEEKVPPGKFKDHPNREESVVICGVDLDGNYLAAYLHLKHDEDDNHLIISDVTRMFPGESEGVNFVQSGLLNILMQSYANALHVINYGEPIDPSDPYKHVLDGGKAVKTDG